MYKLIESDGKEMKEVLSNNKVVWALEEDRKSVLIRTENLTVEIEYSGIIVNRIKNDWDFIEIAGIKFEKSEGEFRKYFYVVFRIDSKDKANQLRGALNSIYTKTDVKQYKYI
ncbi:hypothetical protein [Dolosigranulum savutiense]|uniref:Uncharacterized protein n=1 Tax=Dolosigranulum savutiense TaxID=3110288 RepID=A0AB74U1G8_9LACT